MFAFNPEHHVLLAHLTCLRQPRLGWKPKINILLKSNWGYIVVCVKTFLPVCDSETDVPPDCLWGTAMHCYVIWAGRRRRIEQELVRKNKKRFSAQHRCKCTRPNVKKPKSKQTFLQYLCILQLQIIQRLFRFDPGSNMQMNAWLTFYDTMLFQEGGRARQGVWCCGSSWGGSRGPGGRDVVTRRWVLASVSIDLHVQEQFILFDTPGDKRWGQMWLNSAEAKSLSCRLCKDWKEARWTTFIELAGTGLTPELKQVLDTFSRAYTCDQLCLFT